MTDWNAMHGCQDALQRLGLQLSIDYGLHHLLNDFSTAQHVLPNHVNFNVHCIAQLLMHQLYLRTVSTVTLTFFLVNVSLVCEWGMSMMPKEEVDGSTCVRVREAPSMVMKPFSIR